MSCSLCVWGVLAGQARACFKLGWEIWPASEWLLSTLGSECPEKSLLPRRAWKSHMIPSSLAFASLTPGTPLTTGLGRSPTLSLCPSPSDTTQSRSSPPALSQPHLGLRHRSPGLFLSLTGLPTSRLAHCLPQVALRGPPAAHTSGHVASLLLASLEVPSSPSARPARPFGICLSPSEQVLFVNTPDSLAGPWSLLSPRCPRTWHTASSLFPQCLSSPVRMQSLAVNLWGFYC